MGQNGSPFAMQTQNHAAGFKRRPDDDMVGDVDDSALGADESAVTDPAETLGAASPQSQEIEILRTLRQLRHDYEVTHQPTNHPPPSSFPGPR